MIQHVTREISPEKLSECVSFYGLLGFERVEPPASLEGRAVWLECEGSQLHLVPVPDAKAEAGHIAILQAGYESAVQRLRDAGHDVEPRRAHWGSPRSYVRDPAGNLVELMASAPGASAPGASAPGASAPGASASGASAPGASAPGDSAPGASAPGAAAP
jgi:catechol 2,3-dioxygenase-like lactoylglutathione lyase family enzyme